LLAIARLFGGLSTASQFPATLGYLSAATAHSESLRARVMGFFQIVTLGGTIGGIFLAGRLWDNFGQNGFLISGLVYAASWLVFWLGIREPRQERKFYIPLISSDGAGRKALREALEHYRAAVLEPVVLRFAPAWLAINMVLGVWMNHTIGQLVESQTEFPNQTLHGILADSAQAGHAVSTYGAVLIGLFGLGVVVWSLTLARWRRTSVMLAAISALFALCAILFVLNHSDLAGRLVPIYVVVGLACLFMISSAMPAALTYLADVTEARANDRGAIMGLYTVFFGIGGFLGTLIGGPFADWGAIDGILLITVLLSIAASVALMRLHRFEVNDPAPRQKIFVEEK
jgi:MFS family permease